MFIPPRFRKIRLSPNIFPSVTT